MIAMVVFRAVRRATGRTVLALSIWWAYDWTADRIADSIDAKARKP